MQGFQAIEAANGWVISAMGISIVFTALVLLSLSIAAMPKLLVIIERLLPGKGKGHDELPAGAGPEPAACPVPPPGEKAAEDPDLIMLTAEQWEAINYLRWISEKLGEPFSLPMILDRAEKLGVHRPHFHLDLCLKRSLIMESPVHKGLHLWNREVRVGCEDI